MTDQPEVTTQILISIRDELRAIRTEHGAKLDEHTRILGEHTRILGEHTRILGEHTRILGEHTQMFDEHGHKLDQHEKRLEGLQLAVYEVRADLKMLVTQQAIATNERLRHLEEEVSGIKKKLSSIV